MSVSLDIQGQIAVVEFDDGHKNVVTHQVLDEFEAVWERAEADAQAIVLKGRSGVFCAGYDIQTMTGDDREASDLLGRRGGRLAARIYRCPKPVVGLAQGHAFTIGLVWLAGCDVRMAERGPFKMGMTEVALGVPLTGWALAAMRGRVKPEHQISVLLHAMRCDPEQALEVGLVDQLLPADDGYTAALANAEELAQLPPHAYAKTKTALRQSVLDVMQAEL